jgi:hypothetical protein
MEPRRESVFSKAGSFSRNGATFLSASISMQKMLLLDAPNRMATLPPSVIASFRLAGLSLYSESYQLSLSSHIPFLSLFHGFLAPVEPLMQAM